VEFSNGNLADSIIDLKMSLPPNMLLEILLTDQSNLVNNNPNAYDLISDPKIKTKIRKYYASYEYVKSSIEYSNRINEQYGIPLRLTYYKELPKLYSKPTIGDLGFLINDQKTIAILVSFKNAGLNYAYQIEKFLKVNHELTELLTNYLNKNR